MISNIGEYHISLLVPNNFANTGHQGEGQRKHATWWHGESESNSRKGKIS